MPPAATKHGAPKHNRSSSKLSQASRSNSATKLHPGYGHNLAFTTLKADAGPPKRVDSSQTIRSDHGNARAPNVRFLVSILSSNLLIPVIVRGRALILVYYPETPISDS